MLNTYIVVLKDSLQKKVSVLKHILELTKEQQAILSDAEMDADKMDAVIDEKGNWINQLTDIDKGFESIFGKVEVDLKRDTARYRNEILEMQNLIRVCTSIGVEIQATEQSNNEKFKQFIMNKRNSIKDFKRSNKTATTYYQNMSNQHREWQTYFLDQKK